MWIARNKDGSLYLWNNKPYRYAPITFPYDNEEYTKWKSPGEIPKQLDKTLYPEITWEWEPVKVDIVISGSYCLYNEGPSSHCCDNNGNISTK